MIPMYTSVEDIKKVLGYLQRQVGWSEQTKVEKALGQLDDRKVSAMVEFGLIIRDGGNLRTTALGQEFANDPAACLRRVLANVPLYRATLEWVHYGTRSEVTATEIGQYWEASHRDTLGELKGSTLKDGAVCFGRIVQGAELGSFTVGRGGKETRVSFLLNKIEGAIENPSESSGSAASDDLSPRLDSEAHVDNTALPPTTVPLASASPVAITASPSVHVNVEIHIAADATAETVKEIFKNMARYVLDRRMADDD